MARDDLGSGTPVPEEAAALAMRREGERTEITWRRVSGHPADLIIES
eukprot:COSAG06_NODE_49628_length_324_cov_0.688889_1_plen_46_part_10